MPSGSRGYEKAPAPGRAPHPVAELSKGLQHAPWPGSSLEGLGWRLRREGAVSPIPAVQAWEPRAQGTQPRIRLHPGQAEAGRPRQDSKDTCRWGPQAEQVRGPAPEHPVPCRLGVAVVTAGADSRAGELATATAIVPCVTSCHGQSRAAGEEGPHRINSSH